MQNAAVDGETDPRRRRFAFEVDHGHSFLEQQGHENAQFWRYLRISIASPSRLGVSYG